MTKPFYITTTLPYVNAAPHIGFALEIVQADAIARYKRLMGYDVIFNFGTDEHGQKIWQNALDAGKTPQAYADEYAAKFQLLKDSLNLSYDRFIRTTDAHHKAAAQEVWRRCKAAGDIYKKNYQIKYCVGCELEKTDSELVNGECPLHPGKQLELRDEENYFFKLSNYQDKLSELYSHDDFLVPNYRLNEIRSLIAEKGLQDFSISRPKAKMPWGIEVPDDADHVMYVWFDALVNYISTLGWPEDETTFTTFWNASPDCMQVAGKDQVRQQATMWQAMLMSAGLPRTGKIFIHGFITSGGQKMSKSIGNVIDPLAIVEAYGADALRYFLLRHIHPTEDSDFTMERFAESYNADLVNGLGNLTARIMTMAQGNDVKYTDYLGADTSITENYYGFPGVPDVSYDTYEFNKVLERIWENISALDMYIQKEKPFQKIKTDVEGGKKDIAYLVSHLLRIAAEIEPFMPQTSDIIKNAVKTNKKPENMFPRK